MSTFTPHSLAALAGPAGLADRRARAAERFTATPLPTTDEEVWRYSRIHELDLDRLAPGAVTSTWSTATSGEPRCCGARRPPGASPTCPSRPTPSAGSTTAWRSIRSSSTCPPGVTVREPIVVRHQGPADGIAAAPQLIVRVGEASAATVVELLARRRRRLAAPGDLRRRRTGGSGWSRVGPAARPRGMGHRRARHRRPARGQRHGGPGRLRGRLRPRPHRLPPHRPWGVGQPPGRLLRRRRPDARLPHVPGPRRARHHEQPPVQGSGERPLAIRVHRPHPRGEGRRAAPTPSRRTATSSSPRTRGPSRCRTSRSRTTTSTAATHRRSGRSTRSSASTSRAAACPPGWPSA